MKFAELENVSVSQLQQELFELQSLMVMCSRMLEGAGAGEIKFDGHDFAGMSLVMKNAAESLRVIGHFLERDADDEQLEDDAKYKRYQEAIKAGKAVGGEGIAMITGLIDDTPLAVSLVAALKTDRDRVRAALAEIAGSQ